MRASISVIFAPSSASDRRDAAASPAAPAPAMTMRAVVLTLFAALATPGASAMPAAPVELLTHRAVSFGMVLVVFHGLVSVHFGAQ
ncbi:hypothetical protein HNQ49_000340 [Parapusillimonas granuli]|nr:hypothetical protein [Parapusillimonas granuli]MBB5213674.1 hypothetical protein [Parapusillimonas granuli]